MSILSVAQYVVFVEVINNFLVDNILKEYVDDTNMADGAILRRG